MSKQSKLDGYLTNSKKEPSYKIRIKKQFNLDEFSTNDKYVNNMANFKPNLFKKQTLNKYFHFFHSPYFDLNIDLEEYFEKKEIDVLFDSYVDKEGCLVFEELLDKYEKYKEMERQKEELIRIEKEEQRKKEEKRLRDKAFQEEINNLSENDFDLFKKKYYSIFNNEEIFDLNLNSKYFNEKEIIIGKRILKNQKDKFNKKRFSYISKNR